MQQYKTSNVPIVDFKIWNIFVL